MEVGSVNSGMNAYVDTNRQAGQNRQAVEAERVQQAAREEARRAERMDSPPAQPAAPKVEAKEAAPQPAPKPVVNAQGQQTGTRVNVTA